jgi:1,4-alpha-glucan branching enzyme
MRIFERIRQMGCLLVTMIKNAKRTKKTATASTAVRRATSVVLPVRATASKTGQVTLELVKPGTQQVYVAGSFNGWQPEKAPMGALGDGRWVAQLSLSPGRYEYLFVADGQWLADPKAQATVRNPFGGNNSVLIVAE